MAWPLMDIEDSLVMMSSSGQPLSARKVGVSHGGKYRSVRVLLAHQAQGYTGEEMHLSQEERELQ